MSKQTKSKRYPYKKIDQDLRHQIIDRILNNGQNIKQVSHEMGVNISTCKAIIKVYQQEGRVGKKSKRNKVHNVIQTYSFYCVNDCNVEQIGDIKVSQSALSLERDINFDKHLEDNAKQKAQKMFDKILVDKNKQEQAAAEVGRQLIEMMQNNYMYYYNSFIPNAQPQTREGQHLQTQLTGHQNQLFNINRQTRNE